MRPELKQPRWRERMKAHAGGYFWLPCLVCGEEFGGHERGGGLILRTPERSTSTCPQCPGYWLEDEEHGRFIELRIVLDMDGEPVVQRIAGSSEWPDTVRDNGVIYVG